VEKVCQILEQFVANGTLSGYAIGGATAEQSSHGLRGLNVDKPDQHALPGLVRSV
jgi:hypothetical protein